MLELDKLFGWFACWQTGFFCLVVYSFVLLMRRVTENIYKPIRTMNWWSGVVLPLAPFVVGVLLGALVKSAPYPDGISLTGARIMYGFACGALSGVAYRVLFSIIKQRFPDAPIPEVSAPPVAIVEKADTVQPDDSITP